MKRIIAILILVGCVISMTGCGLVGTIIYGQINKDYEAEEMVFSYDNLSITLTDAFYGTEDEYGYLLTSDAGTAINITKFDYVYSEISPELSLCEQVESVRAGFVVDEEDEESFSLFYNVSEVIEEDGLVYFTADMFLLVEMRSMIFFYSDKDALWMVDFCGFGFYYETYKPHYLKWAGSVDLRDIHTQA